MERFLPEPLLRICQWRGHQEEGTQPGGGKREKWEHVRPTKKFVFLSVWSLIFGIFRYNLLYISSAKQRFGHGISKILFLTKLLFPCLYFTQKVPSLGGGG